MTLNDWPLVLASNESVVTGTPFLPWIPDPANAGAAPAQVRVSQHRAIKVFLRRCDLNAFSNDIANLQLGQLLGIWTQRCGLNALTHTACDCRALPRGALSYLAFIPHSCLSKSRWARSQSNHHNRQSAIGGIFRCLSGSRRARNPSSTSRTRPWGRARASSDSECSWRRRYPSSTWDGRKEPAMG